MTNWILGQAFKRTKHIWSDLDGEARFRLVIGLSGQSIMLAAIFAVGGWWGFAFLIGHILEYASTHRADGTRD
jgi:hypothetical protein